MGNYDSIWARCPVCGTKTDFQSKSGPCNMGNYTLWTAPLKVLLGAIDNKEMCPACSAEFELKLPPRAVVELIEK